MPGPFGALGERRASWRGGGVGRGARTRPRGDGRAARSRSGRRSNATRSSRIASAHQSGDDGRGGLTLPYDEGRFGGSTEADTLTACVPTLAHSARASVSRRARSMHTDAAERPITFRDLLRPTAPGHLRYGEFHRGQPNSPRVHRKRPRAVTIDNDLHTRTNGSHGSRDPAAGRPAGLPGFHYGSSRPTFRFPHRPAGRGDDLAGTHLARHACSSRLRRCRDTGPSSCRRRSVIGEPVVADSTAMGT
jgi:hypothetical protein